MYRGSPIGWAVHQQCHPEAPVIGAVAGAMASSAIAGALTTGFWATTIGGVTMGAIAGAIGGAIVSSVVTGLLTSEPAAADFGATASAVARGILLNKAANDAPIPIIYGLRKVGGTRVFVEASGADNEFLHLVVAMAEGEIDSFVNVYLNDVDINDERFDAPDDDGDTSDSNIMTDRKSVV